MATGFERFALPEEIVEALKRQGIHTPLPVQAMAIPPIAAGKDVLVEAKTGSGKTLAFGVPLLAREPLQTEHPETLVVVPTRELARQIATELTRAAAGLERSVVLLEGGGLLDKQVQALRDGATIVVGTSGRLLELIERKALVLDRCRTLVLDEVDELLQRGFGEELSTLAQQLPAARQTLLFSATVPTEVEALARRIAERPRHLKLTAKRELPEGIAHEVLYTSVDERENDLARWLRAEKPFQALVFCGTREEAQKLDAALDEAGFQTECLHGELSPNKRRQILERFRSGDLPILVATDIAARGLDLPGLTHVVNFTLPRGVLPYVHRIGRTGRAGRTGVALSLVIGQQLKQLDRLREEIPFVAVEFLPSGKQRRRPVKSLQAREAKKTAEREAAERKQPETAPKPTKYGWKPSVTGRKAAAAQAARPAAEKPTAVGAKRPLRAKTRTPVPGTKRAMRDGVGKPPPVGAKRPLRGGAGKPSTGGKPGPGKRR